MINSENCCGATDTGRTRENNQDAFLIGRLAKSMLVGVNSLGIEPRTRLVGDDRGWLMLVADGMGGHAAGERASALAIQYLVKRLLNNVHWFIHLTPSEEQQFIDGLKNLLRDAHHEIQLEGRRNSALEGMGTTLTMAYLVWPTLYVLHAGDSRCYLVRDSQVKCLTTDHTLARRMVESGGLSPEDETASRWSNVLWNVLGGRSEEQLKAEVHQVHLQPGDTIVLCSDGLHRYLSDAALLKILAAGQSCSDVCQTLIDLANAQGGEDNITVIVAQAAHVPRHERRDPLASTATDLPQARFSGDPETLDLNP